tara:strand:- start:6821 stop:7996 length:1176 start_codon:yes stop_codon:yes gene_type:complete
MKYRIAFVHRGLTKYRFPLFKKLLSNSKINFRVFHQYFNSSPSNVGFSQPNNEEISKYPITRITCSRLHTLFYNKLGLALPSFKLISAVIKYNPEIIVLESLSNIGNVLTLTPYILLKKKPFIWWGLGAIPRRKNTLRSSIGDLLQSWYVKRSVCVLSYATFGKEYFVSIGSDPNKVKVLYNTIDEKQVEDNINNCRPLVREIKRELKISDQPVAIFSGTINKGKKLDLLLRSFSRVIDEIKDMDPRLIVIGDGTEFDNCENISKKLNITSSVHFVGRQEDKASAYFLIGQIAIMPGLGGLGINHAFAHKLPMICGNADGCEYDLVVNDKTGFLIEEMNELNLSKKIIKLLSNKKLSNELGKNAYKLITSKISMNKMANRIENAIENAYNI